MAEPAPRFAIRRHAEASASRLPPLLLAAQRVAATVDQGVHGRRRVGLGETFWQFRRYETGDSLRSIDWRQSAKSDHLYIRETEWAAAQSIWLWRDASASMRWSSGRKLPEKRDRADLMLLALASLLTRAGERIGLLGIDERPSASSVALDRLAFNLLGDAPRTDIRERQSLDLPRYENLPRYSHLALFGDFLSPLEEIDRRLRQFAGKRIGGHIVQVLDPAEADLPFGGRTRFEGLEDDGRILIKRVENVRDEYIERMTEHQAGLRDIARSIGWSFIVHTTDQAPERALLALYVRMAAAP
ncbi:MAG: DUF58 domain-containing protein [Rhodospirillaceae bacterium]|nr:DUF58 domain-containing protein [Rhodospirillaceae bacterium]